MTVSGLRSGATRNRVEHHHFHAQTLRRVHEHSAELAPAHQAEPQHLNGRPGHRSAFALGSRRRQIRQRCNV